MPVGSAASKPRKRSTRNLSSSSSFRSRSLVKKRDISSLGRRSTYSSTFSPPQDSFTMSSIVTIVSNDNIQTKDDTSTYAKGISYQRHRSTPLLRIMAISLILFSIYGIVRIYAGERHSSSSSVETSMGRSSSSSSFTLISNHKPISPPTTHSVSNTIPSDTDSIINNDEGTSSTIPNDKILFSSTETTTNTATTELVFWYSWLTAMSTGLGVLPFIFHRIPSNYVLGIANAIASGMMISASIRLCVEGVEQNILGEINLVNLSVINYSLLTVIIGFGGGMFFMYLSKYYLDAQEDLKFSGFSGLDAQKIVLILSVMTLHSATEGIGIGVSFGTKEHKTTTTLDQHSSSHPHHSHAETFGEFISLAMAIHNIPEGLATALVLIPRGSSLTETFLWTIFTSLPQPLLAVPSFISVTYFLPLLSLGLGFAAGAMVFVSVKELIPEATHEIGHSMTYTVLSFAGFTMWSLQNIFDPDE